MVLKSASNWFSAAPKTLKRRCPTFAATPWRQSYDPDFSGNTRLALCHERYSDTPKRKGRHKHDDDPEGDA